MYNIYHIYIYIYIYIYDIYIYIYIYIYLYNEHNKITTIFLDLKKAFDVVDLHDVLLLKKLELYGIRGNIYNLIKSYLNNRTFTTKKKFIIEY